LVDTEFKFIFTKMDILSYLTDLLKTKEEVGIEGLGTFFKVKIPGRYDIENHLFIPPKYTLKFKSDVQGTSHLINYISKQRNITAESAQHYIGSFKEDISRQLAVSNEADLDSLGTLTYFEDNLILKEQDSVNLGSDFYGLPEISTKEHKDSPTSLKQNETEPSVNQPLADNASDNQEVYDEISEPQQIPVPEAKIEIETPETLIAEDSEPVNLIPIQREEIEIPSDNVVDPQESVVSTVSEVKALPVSSAISVEKPLQENVPPAAVESNKPNPASGLPDNGAANIWHFDRDKPVPEDNRQLNGSGEKTPSSVPSWIKGLVLAVLILAILGAIAYVIRPEWFSKRTVSAVVVPTKKATPTPVSPVIIDTVTTDSSTTGTPTAPTDTTKVTPSSVPAQVSATTLPSITWEIIGASLTKKEVNWYIRDMKARGYIAKPLPALPGKRTKMSIATFNDEASAKEGRKLLIQKLKNKDLYIFQNKNTQKLK
jgi:nucleoid DNA-binding protein